MVFKIIFLLACAVYVRSQSSFGTLSSSGIKLTTTTASIIGTSTASFGSLSSAGFRTTTVSAGSTVTPLTTLTTSNSNCPIEAKLACKNGATCVLISSANFFCICTSNFVGIDCGTPVTGTIDTTLTTKTTTATTTTTTTTTTSILPVQCPINVCLNTGKCFIINGVNLLCSCPTGFTGIICETSLISTTTTTTATIPTASSTTTTQVPTTTTTTARVVESCPTDFPPICKNGGSCLVVNRVDIICSCTAGFSGPTCEVTISTQAPTTTTVTTQTEVDCPFNICQNDAKCTIINNSKVECTCLSGFSGRLCENSFCSSSPCLNGGQCLKTDTKKEACLCANEFYGLFCETPSCSPNPCQNGHTCILGADRKPKCLCTARFTGSYCEEAI